MNALLETVIAFFEQHQLKLYPAEAPNLLQTQFKGDNGIWFCYVFTQKDPEQVVFFSVCPVVAPPNKHVKMAEFLTRVNFNLLVGNFDMDFKTGQIRFKTSLNVENDRLTPALLRNLVFANLSIMDSYLPGIMKLIYNELEPLTVLNEINKQ